MSHANMASVSASNIEATCLLLHGSFHSGWCWDLLRPHLPPELSAVTPSLSLAQAQTGLADHVDEITQAIHALPADKPFITVAHSYAGMVLPGAVAQARRTPQLSIFLDAFVPKKGESAFDLLGPIAQDMRAMQVDGFLPPPPPNAFGIDQPDTAAWCAENLVPMPVRTHEDPAKIGATDIALGATVFCRCTGFDGFRHMETRAEIHGWALHSLHTGHDAMITAPSELADLIGALYDQTKPSV